MAEVLFEIPEWLDYADYDNYPSEPKPTTNADFINYSRNQNKLVGALTSAFLWQPNTNFIVGKIIVSPNMPEGMEAVALTGGFTGTVEPAWESDTAEYQDSGVKWKLRYQHWSKENATNRLPNTSYAVGNVVYDRSNLSVALKCTKAGTTSNTELDISGNSVGDTVTDGGVVWEVISRCADYSMELKTFASFTSLSERYGITSLSTVKDIATQMPNYSVCNVYVSPVDSSSSYLPNFPLPVAGLLTITKFGSVTAGVTFELHERGSENNKYIAFYNDISGFSDWAKLVSVNDFANKSEAEAGTITDKPMSPLGVKQAIDAGNFAKMGKLSMPNKNNIITIEASQTEYTAPCDGWLFVTGTIGNNGTNGWLRVANSISVYISNMVAGPTGYSIRAFLPFAKGDKGTISTLNCSVSAIRFVYAQSEV